MEGLERELQEKGDPEAFIKSMDGGRGAVPTVKSSLMQVSSRFQARNFSGDADLQDILQGGSDSSSASSPSSPQQQREQESQEEDLASEDSDAFMRKVRQSRLQAEKQQQERRRKQMEEEEEAAAAAAAQERADASAEEEEEEEEAGEGGGGSALMRRVSAADAVAEKFLPSRGSAVGLSPRSSSSSSMAGHGRRASASELLLQRRRSSASLDASGGLRSALSMRSGDGSAQKKEEESKRGVDQLLLGMEEVSSDDEESEEDVPTASQAFAKFRDRMRSSLLRIDTAQGSGSGTGVLDPKSNLLVRRLSSRAGGMTGAIDKAGPSMRRRLSGLTNMPTLSHSPMARAVSASHMLHHGRSSSLSSARDLLMESRRGGGGGGSGGGLVRGASALKMVGAEVLGGMGGIPRRLSMPILRRVQRRSPASSVESSSAEEESSDNGEGEGSVHGDGSLLEMSIDGELEDMQNVMERALSSYSLSSQAAMLQAAAGLRGGPAAGGGDEDTESRKSDHSKEEDGTPSGPTAAAAGSAPSPPKSSGVTITPLNLPPRVDSSGSVVSGSRLSSRRMSSRSSLTRVGSARDAIHILQELDQKKKKEHHSPSPSPSPSRNRSKQAKEESESDGSTLASDLDEWNSDTETESSDDEDWEAMQQRMREQRRALLDAKLEELRQQSSGPEQAQEGEPSGEKKEEQEREGPVEAAEKPESKAGEVVPEGKAEEMVPEGRAEEMELEDKGQEIASPAAPEKAEEKKEGESMQQTEEETPPAAPLVAEEKKEEGPGAGVQEKEGEEAQAETLKGSGPSRRRLLSASMASLEDLLSSPSSSEEEEEKEKVPVETPGKDTSPPPPPQQQQQQKQEVEEEEVVESVQQEGRQEKEARMLRQSGLRGRGRGRGAPSAPAPAASRRGKGTAQGTHRAERTRGPSRLMDFVRQQRAQQHQQPKVVEKKLSPLLVEKGPLEASPRKRRGVGAGANDQRKEEEQEHPASASGSFPEVHILAPALPQQQQQKVSPRMGSTVVSSEQQGQEEENAEEGVEEEGDDDDGVGDFLSSSSEEDEELTPRTRFEREHAEREKRKAERLAQQRQGVSSGGGGASAVLSVEEIMERERMEIAKKAQEHEERERKAAEERRRQVAVEKMAGKWISTALHGRNAQQGSDLKNEATADEAPCKGVSPQVVRSSPGGGPWSPLLLKESSPEQHQSLRKEQAHQLAIHELQEATSLALDVVHRHPENRFSPLVGSRLRRQRRKLHGVVRGRDEEEDSECESDEDGGENDVVFHNGGSQPAKLFASPSPSPAHATSGALGQAVDFFGLCFVLVHRPMHFHSVCDEARDDWIQFSEDGLNLLFSWELLQYNTDMCAFESSTQQAWCDLVPDLCSDSELVYAVEGGQNLHMALDHKARALVVLNRRFQVGKIVLHRGQELRLGDAERA